jgi:beta-galactosidase
MSATVGHYGDLNSIKKWSSMAKPWGMGGFISKWLFVLFFFLEQGIGWHSTPRQASAFNSERSFESLEGMA